jgi:hypothetical protein
MLNHQCEFNRAFGRPRWMKRARALPPPLWATGFTHPLVGEGRELPPLAFLPPLWGKDRMGGRAMPTGLAALGLKLQLKSLAARNIRGGSRRVQAIEIPMRGLKLNEPTPPSGESEKPDPLRRRPCQRRRSVWVASRLKASRASDANREGMARPPILSFPRKGGRHASRNRRSPQDM